MAPASATKGNIGRPGISASTISSTGSDIERARIGAELAEHRLVGRAARAALGNEQAGGERDDEAPESG